MDQIDNIIDNILDNILEYKNREGDLIRALRPYGIDTYQKLFSRINEQGTPLPASMRDAIENEFEYNDWQEACQKDTIEAYQDFLVRYPAGNHSNLANQKIDQLRLEEESQAAWQVLDRNDKKALEDFISRYPGSSHIPDARGLLNSFIGPDLGNESEMNNLKEDIQGVLRDKSVNNPEAEICHRIIQYINDSKITVQDLLNTIREDNNFISCTVAHQLYAQHVITDFSTTEIDREFLKYVERGKARPKLLISQPPTRITKSPCTEVYFWGIPSSGKTCALGAILSAARSGSVSRSMQMEARSQGYGYMDSLSSMFDINNRIGVLPQGNAISETYEMGFELEDMNGMIHPITFVDLAGELIDAMQMSNSRQPLSKLQDDSLKLLTNNLIKNNLSRKTINRKIHYFVIEYGAEGKKYNDKTQLSLLEAAAQYIKNTKVFEKNTDAIYILISKADKVGAKGPELVGKLRDYMMRTYKNFYMTLSNICKNNKINNGIVEIKPFSIGQIFFQHYCRFDDEAANDVVRTLLKRTKAYSYKELKKLSEI